MRVKLALAGLLAIGSFASSQAVAATGDANALQKVVTALTITKVSDLDFKSAVQGDAAKTVMADVVDNDENASFAVAGEPNMSYVIQLPANSSVIMRTGAGGTPDTEIAVNDFSSYPMGVGLFDGAGTSNLFVGATRAALSPSQQPGDYVGTFTVSVVYP